MAKLEKDGHSVTTSLPSEIVSLKAQGFRVIEEDPKHDKGGELSAGPVVVTNETGRAEAIKPAPKSAK